MIAHHSEAQRAGSTSQPQIISSDAAAGSPVAEDGAARAPSTVRSGHGAHLYWLLAEPYLIDDAGDPPPIHTEFVDRGPGNKTLARKYVNGPDGVRIYQHLDPDGKHRNPKFPDKLSPKAQL